MTERPQIGFSEYVVLKSSRLGRNLIESRSKEFRGQTPMMPVYPNFLSIVKGSCGFFSALFV